MRTLKNKMYKFTISVSKRVYIDKLDDIVNKRNNRNHSTINMKPVNSKPRTYIDFCTENNDKDPKFQFGDHVRMSKYKSIFAKGTFQIGLKKFL